METEKEKMKDILPFKVTIKKYMTYPHIDAQFSGIDYIYSAVCS